MEEPTGGLDEAVLRTLVPQVIGILVRRGRAFADAEDAVADALLEAVGSWPEHPPREPRAWLLRVAERRLIDAQRSAQARSRRELADAEEPQPGPAQAADDTLRLLALCCHPKLSATSAVALTLRAVGGLSTHEIADAFLVPEATMGQRISRAKSSIRGERLDRPGDLGRVLAVLHQIFTAGHRGRVDLAAEAIRLTREVVAIEPTPEARGLLALMLLTHARREARTDAAGRAVPLDRQDRSRWHAGEIAEGVGLVHSALADSASPGEYTLQAGIVALHDDAANWEETDWTQIIGWYDELVGLSANPVAALGRAVAVGHADGPLLGLRAVEQLLEEQPRLAQDHRLLGVRGHLLELAGDPAGAAAVLAQAARRTPSTRERDHLTRQAARLRVAGSEQ